MPARRDLAGRPVGSQLATPTMLNLPVEKRLRDLYQAYVIRTSVLEGPKPPTLDEWLRETMQIHQVTFQGAQEIVLVALEEMKLK